MKFVVYFASAVAALAVNQEAWTEIYALIPTLPAGSKSCTTWEDCEAFQCCGVDFPSSEDTLDALTLECMSDDKVGDNMDTKEWASGWDDLIVWPVMACLPGNAAAGLVAAATTALIAASLF